MSTDQLSAAERLELERLRLFVRRLAYLRSHMAGGELAMLDALTDARYAETFDAMDRAILRESA